MTASGIKPTRIALRGAALPDEASIDGVYSGDDVDWDLAPGEGGQDQWKQPVRCATTAAITIAAGLNAGDSIDGVTLVAGDRVLVKDQAAPEENGIYTAGTTPARAPDMDADEEVLGAVVHVYAGTVNAGSLWRVTNTAATTVDTDAIDWAAISGGSSADTSLATVAATGDTETVDVSTARTWDLTLDAATVTLTLTGAVAGEAWGVTLLLRQDSTGGRLVTWPASVSWPGSTEPVLSTDPAAVDIIALVTLDGGVTWFGAYDSSGTEPIATAHIADTTDAHDASAISVLDTGGNFTGTDVEAVLAELAAAVPSGHYEVVVSGSAPPVAVSTPSDDDWVYAWVED